jgi:hypothetical protein
VPGVEILVAVIALAVLGGVVTALTAVGLRARARRAEAEGMQHRRAGRTDADADDSATAARRASGLTSWMRLGGGGGS